MGAQSAHWQRAGLALLLVLAPEASAIQAPAEQAKLPDPTASWQQTRYSTRQGLPQNWVTALAQTRDGYLWVGTQGGLARFDGTHFRVFDMASTPELCGNRIRTLFEASSGDLWVGTTSGGLLRMRGSQLTSFLGVPGTPPTVVREIHEDSTGALWFAGSILTRYRDGTFEEVSIGNSLSGRTRVRSFHRDPQGTLWAATNLGLARLAGDEWVLLDAPPELSPPLLVGQSSRGTWALGNNWFAHIEGDQVVPVSISGKMPARLSCALLDQRGNAWVAGGRGLFLLRDSPPDQPSAPVDFLPASPRRRINGTFFEALLEDNEGNLWVGLDALIRLRPQPFVSIPLPPEQRVRLAVLDGTSGLDGAWAAAPNLRNYREREWKSFEEQGRWVGTTALVPARAGGLWIGSSDSVLTRMQDGEFVDHEHDLGQVLCMSEGPQGALWIMTREGLASFAAGVFTRHPMEAMTDRPTGEPVVMGWTRAGDLWLGWKGEIVVREPSGQTHSYTPEQGLPRGEVRAIHEAEDGAVWIATYGTGLSRWRDGEFVTLTSRNGLPDNSLGAILEDDSRNLWINSNQGVFKTSLETLNEVADGSAVQITARMITSTEGDGTAGGKLPGGRLWFRSITSLDVIDPLAVETPRAPPRLILERVVANDEVLDHGGSVRIPPGAGNLEFEFAVVNFSDPGHARVRYRLEGFEDNWVESPTARSARYPSVPPGKYRFVLSASNGIGTWGDTVLELDVELQPFYWQTSWFAGLAALLLTGAVMTYHRLRMRGIRARNARLQDEVDRRLLVEITRDEQEERLQLALSSAEMGTWRWDPALDRTTLDASMCRMFGMEAKDITIPSEELLTRIHPEDLPGARAAFMTAVVEHNEFSQEFRIVRPNGETRWHRDRGCPHFDSQGRLLYVTGASTDITERKLAEEQRLELEENLRHRHKMEAIGQLASGVAHEFNNLLVGILCNTDLLLETTQHSLDAVSRKRIRDIDHCGERAAALTHKLLSFAKREISRDSRFCVNGVVLDAETMLEGILGERITLALELGQDLPAVVCDRAHIEQGLLNLVLNARDAAAGDGQVTIRTSAVNIDAEAVELNPDAHEGVYAMLSVTDTGCGMSEQTRERIFEPFFTTKPTGEGTGLGLSTLFADVSNAGGYVTVQTSEGTGSTFSVFLPQGEPTGALPALNTPPPTGAPAPCEETILVCDDEQVVLSSVASVLTQEGYEVLEAWGAEDARAVVEDHTGDIHLLLVDVVMPESNGPELARELLLTHPSMEVMFMSGYPADVLRVEGREFEFLKKPPSRKTLLRRVEAVLARARETAQLRR